MKIYSVVLAAGKGTRMKTEMPKCAYPLLKKPMLMYIVEALEESVVDDITVVIGHKAEVFEEIFGDRVTYAYQKEQLGTGHAVLSAASLLEGKDGLTVILAGDVPLVSKDLIDRVVGHHQKENNALTIVSCVMPDPNGYGRIVRDANKNVVAIIEEKDASAEIKKIKEINSALYVVDNKLLFDALKQITPHNAKHEYYLTDIVKIIGINHRVGTYIEEDHEALSGINDLYSLSLVEKRMRMEVNKKYMMEGVNIVNPETVTIASSVKIEAEVTIFPNTYLTGNTIIKRKSQIGPNTEINNGTIGEYCTVKHALIHDSEIKNHSIIGPFAHVRNNSVIGEHNIMGNFVEVKKTVTGKDVKATHLVYIGDTTTGDHVNFGSGSVTVNFDGEKKHQTIIGDDVFIGANTNLIAPLTIGDNVFIAAGSTISKDIPKDSFAIARSEQVTKVEPNNRFKK
ncbi:MAG TPA: bifunctional UDP-N-acetylglucosamine diphosphorylase/glucosamine-1-phosphate N-acetyltransferase GlmU [Bacilli bacterium]|nr:bifunctional UDP-N-acetylglucosamine diphosphorylase/glucosamine-1-phosphate N-acetyltransferase GlmU [Bacilli bacterium]